VTVISAGPVTASAAALAWARCADGTLLVARRGHTRRDAVRRARRGLAEVGGRLQGTVLADPPRVPQVDARALLERANASWLRLLARAQGTGQAPS
jgi:Mrp family chromosome partitioning ATPase